MARDATERKEADRELALAKEEAVTANLAKSEFLSRMSHELRTPLNAILGFGQLLEKDELGDSQRESVGQILRGGRHLLSLVDEVLDISRIETGSMRVSLEPVELLSALRDAVALIAPVAEEAGVTLSTELLAIDDCHVLADSQRLRQVVLNLLSNAVKYSRPQDTVTVSYLCASDRVRITVSDIGPGIPAEKLGRLFVAFDRLDAEDNPSNARLVEQAFASLPAVRVVVAMQGSTGVDFAKAHLPDLILLDLHLPDMNGSIVLNRLQADTVTAGIPVIVLSADATQGQVRDLMTAGALAYLTKPLDIPEFLAVVSEHLPAQVIAG